MNATNGKSIMIQVKVGTTHNIFTGFISELVSFIKIPSFSIIDTLFSHFMFLPGGNPMKIVIVGDGKGKIGVATGKAKEVPEAIEKATLRAKKNMVSVSIVDNTIPHTVVGKFGRGAVLMMPAVEGTGVIAGGPVRAVMEAVGIKNIRTKSHGSQNSGNCVKAAIEGLKELKTAEQVAALRGKTVEEILS